MATEPWIVRGRVFRFGPFELFEQLGELRKNGVRIKLQEQPLRVLLELVSNAGNVITREELKQKLWQADTFVDFDVGLNTAIRKLRQALGDDADHPHYIETLAKRGYRFVAAVADSKPPLHVISGVPPRPNYYRRWMWIAISGAALGGVVAVIRWWNNPPRPPLVTAIKQLTDDGEAKCCRLATDGSRIYFNEGSIGSFKLAQVGVNGGETGSIPTALGDARLVAIDPQGTDLLVSSGSTKDNDPSFALWNIPLPVGEAHHFRNIEAGDGGYFPDGRIVFARGNDIYIAEKDGTNSRKLFGTSGLVGEPFVSPDGKRIAFNSFSEDDVAVVVSKLDGTTVRKISASCCARWTPDGQYLVYSNVDVARKDLWAVPAETGFFRRPEKPMRLTNGPLSFGGSGVILGRTGNQVFTIGKNLKGELVRFDMRLKRFMPILPGVSASSPAFSKDGKWVAYLSYPDRTMWRSRVDGTERLPLSTRNLAGDPFFLSPDGKQVLFSGEGGIFTISMEGSTPQQIIGENAEAASWSPDGKAVLLTARTSGKAYLEKNSDYLQTFDLQSGKLTVIPGSDGIDPGVAAWWLTQDLLVASAPSKLKIFDFKAQKWSDLLLGDFVSCRPSLDSKYIYCASGGAEPKALRIRMADRKVETITSLKDIRRTGFSSEISVAADGSPVFTRDVGSQQIYALTVAWP